jgi:GNAT superfamily N-acetyltransferase
MLRAHGFNTGKSMSLVEVEPEFRPAPSRERRSAPSLAGSLARGPQLARVAAVERERLQEFLLRLDRDSRLRRFGHAASDAALCAHARTAVSQASVVLGVERDGGLRGVLEIYSCAPHPFCEAALVVEPGWRCQGLGFALLRAAARFCCAHDSGGIRLIFTRDNWPMRRLADKAEARFDLVLDEICAEVAPARLAGAA